MRTKPSDMVVDGDFGSRLSVWNRDGKQPERVALTSQGVLGSCEFHAITGPGGLLLNEAQVGNDSLRRVAGTCHIVLRPTEFRA